MDIVILSREEAQTWKSSKDGIENNILIRILEPRNSSDNLVLKDPGRFSDILELYFDDITKESYEDHLRGSNFVLYSDIHASDVLDFLSVNKCIDTLVIHCHAGISRSSGLGLAISEYFNLPEVRDHILNSGLYIPNSTVYDITKSLLLTDSTSETLSKLPFLNSCGELEFDLSNPLHVRIKQGWDGKF